MTSDSAIKKNRGGCLNCPNTEDVLSPDTVLYNGFGGYRLEKNGKIFYQGRSNAKWEQFKNLKQIERIAAKSPRSRWRVVLDNPLRGAIWSRKRKGEWILISTNKGFA